jgi:hypothetical protein
MATETMKQQDPRNEVYIAERNAALQGSLADFKVWADRWGVKTDYADVPEIVYHKLRTAVPSLPMEMRSASKRWLIERNLLPMDDGDVPFR